MEKRMLGKTGLQVTVLGFGGIPIQRLSPEEAQKVIRTALDNGINYIDTARSYTDSEPKIGLAIKGKRDRLILASKSMARSADKMAAEVDKSLQELGVDYIDLYQCHNVRTGDDLEKVTGPGGAVEALQDAQRAGKIGHIGITGHQLDILTEALKTDLFSTVMAPYNFIEPEPEEVLLPLARQKNIGVIAMKPLGGGSFSWPAAALKYLFSRQVSTVIPGVDSIQQVEENVRTALSGGVLTPEEQAYLDKETKEVGSRFCRRCDYCKPCPQNVDISNNFLFDAYYTRYDMKEWAIKRYNALSVKADACVECGACETRCPYNLPIRDMLKQVHQHLGQRK